MARVSDQSGSAVGMPPTRAAAVAQQIRAMILSGEIAPGAPLRQVEIAELFGVSTTPVREAFTALAKEGIVVQDAHRGVVVFKATREDVEENYEIRIALEVLAAERAAKAISEHELDELDNLVVEMERATKTDLTRHATILNPRFHAIINTAAGRPRLAEMIESLRKNAVAYQSLIVTPDLSPSYLSEVHDEHREIAAALRARSPKRAGRAVRAHIEHNRDQIVSAMGAHADKVGVA